MFSIKYSLLVLAVLAGLIDGLKIAIFSPDVAGGQLIFNKKVAETLAKSGHSITFFRLRALGYKHLEVHIDQRQVKVADVIAYTDEDFNAFHREQGAFIFSNASLFSPQAFSAYHQYANVSVTSCAELLTSTSFILNLREEAFDIAFASSFDYCSIGLIHEAKVPTWIWLNAGPLSDLVAEDIGVPSPPSYVPFGFSESTDRLTFPQRVANVLLKAFWPHFARKVIADPETALFRKHIREDFPDLRELARQAPLVFVDSQPFYDFTRPTLEKVISVGGLGLVNQPAKNLTESYTTLIDKFDNIALVSFGTVADSTQLPTEWKEALLNVFAKFPRILFVVRYSGVDLEHLAPTNVFLVPFFPQHDLMQHRKTILLLTNGGFASIQEAIYNGIPVIVVPLFGDQRKNAHLVEKHGFGLALSKSEVSETTLYDSIKEVLSTKRYYNSATRLQNLVLSQPFTAEEKVVKWTEFLARHKNISNLEPAGNQLNFIEYHNIDVFALFGVVILLSLYVLYGVLYLIAAPFLSSGHAAPREHVKFE
uniref:glucuronosyltransferase n=1 Tax=Panagrellus redivivus TaxID=6233 RepID=A0A7E4VG46_PANRE